MQNNTIQIYSCNKKIDGDTISLLYDIGIIEKGIEIKRSVLRYSLERKYEDYLCCEVSDGIIVTLLPYALRGGL